MLVGELNAAGNGVDYLPVNACIQLLPSLDGKSVKTVESLKKADGTLHPVQEEMIKCHGSQCGFCTPGMLVRSYRLLIDNPDPTEEEIRAGISGNLCRCTGYQNIVKAVQQGAKAMA